MYIALCILLVSIFCIIKCKNPFFNVYQLLYTVFFVTPYIILNADDLSNGLFFNAIVLDNADSFLMRLYMLSTSLVLSFISLLLPSLNFEYILSGRSLTRFSLFFLLTSFFIVAYFNIVKAISVYSVGYQEFLGTASNSKNIAVVLLELYFIYKVLVSKQTPLTVLIFFLYCLSGMVGGQRIPYFFMLLAYCVSTIKYLRDGKGLLIATFLGFVVAVPFLMWIQLLRNGFLFWDDSDLFFESYSDVMRVVYFSLDTVKAVFMSSHPDLEFNPLGKFIFYLNILLTKFSIDYSFEVNTFGSVYSSALDPYSYSSLNVTFASSAAAEFFLLFGWVSILIFPVYIAFCTNKLFAFALKLRNHALYLCVIAARGLFGTIRNEAFGWIVDFLIFIFFGLIFYWLGTCFNRLSKKQKGELSSFTI